MNQFFLLRRKEFVIDTVIVKVEHLNEFVGSGGCDRHGGVENVAENIEALKTSVSKRLHEGPRNCYYCDCKRER